MVAKLCGEEEEERERSEREARKREREKEGGAAEAEEAAEGAGGGGGRPEMREVPDCVGDTCLGEREAEDRTRTAGSDKRVVSA